MSTRAASAFGLTDDELQVVGSRLGVTEFPTVLAVRPRHGTVEALARATDLATGQLAARGLIGSDGVDTELAEMVTALRRPAREIAIRLVTPDGLARISLVQTGFMCVAARWIGNGLQLRAIDSHTGIAGAVIAELPASQPAAVEPFSAPATDLAECLSGGHSATFFTDRLRALGAGHQVASALGSAFAARIAFAEIVCHVLDAAADRVVRVPGAVAVFYTKRGRLVSAPSVSPSGQLWTTIKPGSDHRVMQAISQLAELTPSGWEGDAR